MTSNTSNQAANVAVLNQEDDAGGGNRQGGGQPGTEPREHQFNCEQQSVDIFVRHVGQQLKRELENKQRRPSLPVDVIELPTLNGVVMRRKQQLQLKYQQAATNNPQATPTAGQLAGQTNEGNGKVALVKQHLAFQQQQQSQNQQKANNRPLSICSISSAVSSGSSSSANSSASSGIQSSFTRNGSLNYGLEYRKSAYLASIESLNNPPQATNHNLINSNFNQNQQPQQSTQQNLSENESANIEAALKNLNLSPSGQFKDAAARAAILAAGAQSRGFIASGGNVTSNISNFNDGIAMNSGLSRINRSLHASLRYDKNTAYRIQLMANARALFNSSSSGGSNNSGLDGCENTDVVKVGSISRNNSSTSSDSGYLLLQQNRFQASNLNRTSRFFVCQCGLSNQTMATSSSASQVYQAALTNEASSTSTKSDCKSGPSNGNDSGVVAEKLSNKAATLDGSSSSSYYYSIHNNNNHHHNYHRNHHPDCSYANIDNNGKSKLRRGSLKLQPSPSSASSHSNTSSLFRDDGFEDDLVSTGSEQMSNYQQHRLSFQGRISSFGQHRLRRFGSNGRSSSGVGGGIEDDDEYQSCEEEFANSNTTASSSSNFDDCALSTTSSSIINHHHNHHLQTQHQQVFDEISLANAKQQYRKSLLLEHQQQQHLLHSQHVSQNSKIQSLITTSPKISLLGSSSVLNQNANNSTTSSNNFASSNNLLSSSPNKQSKCDDRTVNIIGHMPTKSPGYWDSNLSITQRVVTEIIETERTYVDDLEQIVTGYICYLRNVLKKQKQQLHKSHKNGLMVNINSQSQQSTASAEDGDYKSMIVFDDDQTNAANEVDEYDVDETDNDLLLTSTKENDILLTHNSSTVNQRKNLPNASANKNHGNFKLKTSITNIDSGATMMDMSSDDNDTSAIIITANHIKKLFSNLEDIYKFNKDLLFRLEECYLNPSSVAECFVENASGFEVYTHYCTMYPQVVSTLTELMAHPRSAQLLRERQNELEQSLPLGAYLLKPVQRILKYHILFQSLIKHTCDDESVNEKDGQLINEAFSVMTSIACHINAMKKRHEHAIRVQEVQGLLSGWDGPDLTTLGELILEDTFKLYNRPKSNRHLFLFDNVLLFTKKKRDGSLCYKGHIACNNLMLIENIEGQPFVFNTVPFDNPKALHAFQAKNLDKKREWCLQMKEMILKSYEVKIPVHVRDILMSLTTSSNNSDQTTTASPKYSSSETTKALLKAPNYLEKKRSKQDKHKHK